MLDQIRVERVYIACGYTDMRSGIDRLAALVKTAFQQNPYTNTLYLFCGRRADRIKALYWDADGFILLYKRLEQGQYQFGVLGQLIFACRVRLLPLVRLDGR